MLIELPIPEKLRRLGGVTVEADGGAAPSAALVDEEIVGDSSQPCPTSRVIVESGSRLRFERTEEGLLKQILGDRIIRADEPQVTEQLRLMGFYKFCKGVFAKVLDRPLFEMHYLTQVLCSFAVVPAAMIVLTIISPLSEPRNCQSAKTSARTRPTTTMTSSTART